jgi:hypothetical protein
VDVYLATYDASSTISGIDDRAILATVVKAIKDLYGRAMTGNEYCAVRPDDGQVPVQRFTAARCHPALLVYSALLHG